MSRINNMLNSKPAMPVAAGAVLVGAAAVALGLIALVGRFDFANKMGHVLGKAGKIGLTAGGGAALGLAVAAIACRAISKQTKPAGGGEAPASRSPAPTGPAPTGDNPPPAPTGPAPTGDNPPPADDQDGDGGGEGDGN